MWADFVIQNELKVSDIPSISLPEYSRHPDHSTSNGTRQPGFYDMHLDVDLRLRRIAISEDLPEVLQHIYNSKMSADLLAAPTKDFRLRKIFNDNIRHPPTIKCESDIRNHYPDRTAEICIPLASAIICHQYAHKLGVPPPANKNQFVPIFRYVSTDTTKDPGLADIYINPEIATGLLSEISTDHQKIIKQIEKEISLLKKHHLVMSCPLEIKSLLAGDEKTMRAIIQLARSDTFRWMECGTSHHGKSAFKCGNAKHTRHDGQQTRTGRKTGPDSNLDWFTEGPDCGKKRPHNSEESSGGSKEDSNLSTLEDVDQFHHMKACYIVQQVWAELVAIDATFCILSSGNHEIIMRRHRDSGTLFISKVIQPSEKDTQPSHYVLHTAVYVAAYLDSVNRAEQIDALKLKERKKIQRRKGLPSWWKLYESGIYDGDNLAYAEDMALIPAMTKTQKDKQQQFAYDTLSEKLETAEEILVHLPVSLSPQQTSFRFRRITLSSNVAESLLVPLTASTSVDPIAVEVVTLSSPRPISGDTVWQATASMGEHSSGQFVVKFAQSAKDRERLLDDYTARNVLISTQKDKPLPVPVVKAFGMFTCDSDVTRMHSFDILVMENGGMPLCDLMAKANEASKELRKGRVKLLAQALKENNFLHNRLSSNHILGHKDPQSTLALISLSAAKSISDEFQEDTKKRRALLREDRLGLVMAGLVDDDLLRTPRRRKSPRKTSQ